MKRTVLCFLFATSLFGNVVLAQGTDPTGNQIGPADSSGNVQSISGDALCGGSVNTICKPSDLKTLLSRLIPIVVASLTLATFFFVVWFLVDAKIKEAQGNSKAMQEAKSRLFNLIITFILIVLLLTGFFLVVLRGIGVKEDFLTLIKLFAMENSLIPHAYAQELPNALGNNSIYDIALNLFSAFIRFAVYPALIYFWVLAGFKFVTAQGNPKEINTAKRWLWTTFLITVVIFTAQGFLLGIRGTINNILGNKATQSSYGTNTTSAPATPTSPGASCQTPDGYYGQIGSDGTCQYGGTRGGNGGDNPPPASKVCYQNGVYGDIAADGKTCNLHVFGTACTQNGITGRWSADGSACLYGGSR